MKSPISLYLTKIPPYIPKMFKNIVWHGDRNEKVVYLTFDDGPHPKSTPLILDVLNKFDVKATFFCLGQNVEKYPELFQRIIDEGHQVGNHSYSHLSGWTTSTNRYLKDIEKANQFIDSNLFRPPYGRITPWQAKKLSTHYRIIMWDIMPGDFDERLTQQKVTDNVIDNIEYGSVIVLHDNPMSGLQNIKLIIKQIIENGYSLNRITI